MQIVGGFLGLESSLMTLKLRNPTELVSIGQSDIFSSSHLQNILHPDLIVKVFKRLSMYRWNNHGFLMITSVKKRLVVLDDHNEEAERLLFPFPSEPCLQQLV